MRHKDTKQFEDLLFTESYGRYRRNPAVGAHETHPEETNPAKTARFGPADACKARVGPVGTTTAPGGDHINGISP
jgi:hypothetical protein